MEPLLLITNTESDHVDDLGIALEVLRSSASVEVCETSNPGELDGVLHRAGSRPIVVAGDDDSVHAVIAMLHRRNDLAGKTLGLLPLGIENDFARSAGVPLDPATAAEALLSATPRPMDLIVDELGEVVVNTVHAGAAALAGTYGAVWKERLGRIGLGALGYPLGAALAAINPTYVRVRIEVDGEAVCDLDRQVLMVSIGGPSAGSLDVMIAYAPDPFSRIGYAVDVLRRNHADRNEVTHVRGSRVSITGEDFWISADGEISGPERRRTWHVEPAAYGLLAR